MKALIVEDDALFQVILNRWLTDCGHEVVGTASNKTEALRLFRAHKPGLITMDGSLENSQSGLNIAATIRADDSQVVIVMITGHRDIQFEGRGMWKGGITYEEFREYFSRVAQQPSA